MALPRAFAPSFAAEVVERRRVFSVDGADLGVEDGADGVEGFLGDVAAGLRVDRLGFVGGFDADVEGRVVERLDVLFRDERRDVVELRRGVLPLDSSPTSVVGLRVRDLER